MTGDVPEGGPRRTRWLPVTVFSLFALVVLADAVVIVLYGNYRNVIEETGVEMVFTPADPSTEVVSAGSVGVVEGARIVSGDGTVLVRASDDRVEVLVPGSLVFRTRAHNAGSFVEFGYRFGKRRSPARCDLTVARVASRHGVDRMCRRSLVARKKPKGVFRHYLADHAGWIELSLDVNAEAAEVGFELTKPEIVRE